MEKLLKDEIKTIFPRIKVRNTHDAYIATVLVKFPFLGTRRYPQKLSWKAPRGNEASFQN